MIPRRTIVIDGRRWRVVVAGDVFDDDGKSVLGTCDANNRTLEIKRTDENVMRDTLLHEALHALDGSLTERQVLNLERGLYALAVGNRALWRWVFEREE